MAKIKLADYVATWLAEYGVRHVFVIAGGASLHLIHGIAKTPGIDYVCPGHEQAGAFAADGYTRASGSLGVAMATSGPGATNLLTGAAGAYYDSVPVMFITGQVATFRFKNKTGVRQMGFQETDTMAIFHSVTKLTVQVKDPMMIRHELERAALVATSGRMGPVLVDIPDNVQRMIIDTDKLPSFTDSLPEENELKLDLSAVQMCGEMIKQARRPVIIYGWGVRLGIAERAALELIRMTEIPAALTWATADMMEANDPQLIGTFGTHGTRYANFAIQNADLLLSVGARLDTRATGGMDTFAREAKKIVVDVDKHELGKFAHYGMSTDLLVNASADEFLEALLEEIRGYRLPSLNNWMGKIIDWKKRYPICPQSYYEQKAVNPYVFVKTLSALAEPGEALVIDTGCAIAWVMQAFEFKAGQRLWHDFNNTAMGWALPASVGISLVRSSKQVICVTGDGSLMMNMQELATVVRHKLPIKIFVLDNQGYSMIQQTQDQWLDSKYEASNVAGGLGFPDWEKIGKAYGMETRLVEYNLELKNVIGESLHTNGPALCVVKIAASHRVSPQVKYGWPLEDSEPLLPRQEFLKNMIVKPLEVSVSPEQDKVRAYQ